MSPTMMSSLCALQSYFKCKALARIKFPRTPRSRSVSPKGRITWDPLPPSLPTDSPPIRPATGDETDSSHISAQLDGVFIITTQRGSDRGRKQQRGKMAEWWERWRGGEELRQEGEEGGRGDE